LWALQEHTEPVDLIEDTDYPDQGVGIQKVPADHKGTIIGELTSSLLLDGTQSWNLDSRRLCRKFFNYKLKRQRHEMDILK
jgi:hypothetical protein